MEHNAQLIYRFDYSDSLAVFRIRPLDGPAPAFVAGQYAELALPGSSDGHETSAPSKIPRRAYSIASPPRERDFLEFYIVRVDDGIFTPNLWQLHLNDKLWMGTKTKGKFTLECIPPEKDLVMVSTGTGIAPYVSMLREHRNAAPLPWRRFIMLHGVRKPVELGYREELEQYAAEDPRFFYIPIISRPDGETWAGLTGHVQRVFTDSHYQQITGAELNPEQSHVFLCGNPAMISDMQQLLESRDFRLHKRSAPGSIHVERYW